LILFICLNEIDRLGMVAFHGFCDLPLFNVEDFDRTIRTANTQELIINYFKGPKLFLVKLVGLDDLDFFG